MRDSEQEKAPSRLGTEKEKPKEKVTSGIRKERKSRETRVKEVVREASGILKEREKN